MRICQRLVPFPLSLQVALIPSGPTAIAGKERASASASRAAPNPSSRGSNLVARVPVLAGVSLCLRLRWARLSPAGAAHNTGVSDPRGWRVVVVSTKDAREGAQLDDGLPSEVPRGGEQREPGAQAGAGLNRGRSR